MPAQRPRASFEPIAPDFDLKTLVETMPRFDYVMRINYEMIESQGQAAFEKLILLHVIIGGKPLVIDGFDLRLDGWTFSPKWLHDNCGDKVENARNLTNKESLPLTMGHYLNNMSLLTNQFFEIPRAYRDKKRQRVYLKDIDCPQVWWDKLKEHLPPNLTYLNDGVGEIGGPGAAPDRDSTVPGRRLGRGIARSGDLMSSLPSDMRAQNLQCYIGHEGTYTPAHREMCASLGHNIMVEASATVSADDRKVEKPGSSIWFMTESKDRHLVSEYWLSVLGHDIEVENHFAQVIAWKKAPFNVYVVEQQPGDLILIPPLAPHQVWNRGTRTMKVAWNRTTVETLELALSEALPNSRIVCRDEQYKNKAIIYYTLQKYASLLGSAQQQASSMPAAAGQSFMYSPRIKQLKKDFSRLFAMFGHILLSEMFSPEERDTPKSLEYIPFDSNVTCAYCRGNIFNRFLTCPSCKDVLGHHADDGEDPYDVCLDCYAMGRSCACISGLKWVEQFKWKELTGKYEAWRKLIIALDGAQTAETPLPLLEERKRYGQKTLAEVCKDQLKRRPFNDISKPAADSKDDEADEEIVVGDDGLVKKINKRRSKAWLRNNQNCHVCCGRHPIWKMAACTTCDRWFCYGTLFRGWDKMPLDIMQDPDFSCPHCLGICFAGGCKSKMNPYEPKGTLLGHDTKKVADVRSVEALVDFSVSNLNWLKADDPADRTESRRFQRANAEAQKNKAVDPSLEEEEDAFDQTQMDMEDVSMDDAIIDPALLGVQSPAHREKRKSEYFISGALPGNDEDEDAMLARQLQAANSALTPPAAMTAGVTAYDVPEGHAPLASTANTYPQPDDSGSYLYPGAPLPVDPISNEMLRPFMKRRHSRMDGEEDGEADDIAMSKPKWKKPRLAAAGFRSSDLATDAVGTSASKAKTEAQRQFEKDKERKAHEKARAEGRFIIFTAAFKGKKCVVKLPVPGARLAQLVAQQAAKAALMGVGDGDSEALDDDHEAVGGAARPARAANDEDIEPSFLLKSDIAPKKQHKDHAENYQRRFKQGKIVTGNTKKALIPVERDENYGDNHHERGQNKKRATKSLGAQPTTVASTKEKRESRRTVGRTFDYEEVDIGSDEDEDGGQDTGFVAVNGSTVKASSRGRRSLPGYLQDRHADEGDLPDMLPNDFFETGMYPRAVRKHPIPAARTRTAPGKQLQDETQATANAATANGISHTAGKRPSMRPTAASTIAMEIDSEDENDEDANVTAMVNAAINGDFMTATTAPQPPVATTNGTMVPSLSASRPSTGTGRPRGRPSKPLGLRPQEKSAQPTKLTAQAQAQAQAQATAQKTIAEQNRQAKLAAFSEVEADLPAQSVTGGARKAGQYVFSDDDDDDFETDDDDDDIDEVPARAPVRF